MDRPALPVDVVLPLVIRNLAEHGALVLKAEPGAGKTTRVAPAILDSGLATLPNNQPGQIVVLQPRRVAARAAAARISDERGTELGQETGYQVRFELKFGRSTRILICTEGVFLRRLQEDPFIENVSAVVFDEFHERSVDVDLSLAMVRQVRSEVRPDLKVVVMSATLDGVPIADYLGGCPVVECPGRTFPVEIDFLCSPDDEPVERQVAAGVRKVLSRCEGHVLAFLPGVGEIRLAEELLESVAEKSGALLLPLYGDMPLDEQQRVLRPAEKRKIILATNVAETSLTIDGVKAVVDSGLAKVSRLDTRLGLNRLEVKRISRASAEQRAGRAGRTSKGYCLRLWTEREHRLLDEFEAPEISRVDLSDCILQLLAWGESDVRNFPWFERPKSAALDQALLLLDRLDATGAGGNLTEIGRRMARLPLQPRLARLMVEAVHLGCAERAAIVASTLSERDPFRRQAPGTVAEHHSHSDVLDRLMAIESFAGRGPRGYFKGEIMGGAARLILRASDLLLKGLDRKKELPAAESEEGLMRSLLVAFPDRVCKRREPKGRRALMVGGRGVKLADESAVLDSDLFVAVELMDSGQSETLVRQASHVERSWLPESHLLTEIELLFDQAKGKVSAVKRTRFIDLVIEESAAPIPADACPSEIFAATLSDRSDLETLVSEDSLRYMARVQSLSQWMPELELPEFGQNSWKDLLPEWCIGCTSIDDLKASSLIPVIQSRMSRLQQEQVDELAPESILVPSGRRIKLEYEPGKPPVLAVRIQELFGLSETPKVARGKVSVLLHLLAPNYRVQQITPDLSSFWKNTYADVKKELRRRYPKHSWPDDPLIATPESRPQRKNKE